jgi:hypothetical protein
MKERAVYEVQEELQVPHNSNVEVWTALGVSTGAQLRLYRRWGWRNWEDTGDKIAGATGQQFRHSNKAESDKPLRIPGTIPQM